MPLINSTSKSAFSENVSRLMHENYPQKQALAIAYSKRREAAHSKAAGGAVEQAIALSNARRYGHAAGGGVQSPFAERMAARNLFHQGFLNSAVPGRTDKLPITVGGGAFVLPADHVAAIGQGNSLSGADIVNRMFRMGPYGTPLSPIHQGKAPMPRLSLNAKPPAPGKLAKGGKSHGHPTDIIAAGGEIVIPPEKIIERFGDLDKGHRALNQWVKDTRRKHIQTLKKLPGPAR